MNRENIHILIERYFEGETTPVEEKELLNILLTLPPGDPEVEETLAVMGYSRMIPKRNSPGHHNWWKYAVAAVMLPIIIAIGFSIFHSHDSANINECYAYIGGERIENEAIIRSLVTSQLEEMSIASDEINSQIATDLSDFHGLLETN